MTNRWPVVAMVLAALAAPGGADEGSACSYRTSFRGVEYGRDGSGYFVRVSPTIWAGREAASAAPVDGFGDFVASEAGATIVYLTRSTETKLFRGEWRGDTPLAALQAFAAAGGLQVEVPQPNVWVIGPPDFRESSAVRISIAPAFPEEQSLLWGQDTAEVEEALIRALPVRDVGSRGKVDIRVEYYWIAEEPAQTLLVSRHLQSGTGVDPRYGSGFYRAFKVRLHREAGGVRVECLWASLQDAEGGAPEGRLIPEVAEDFDGGGLRDFFFSADGDRPNVVLSGEDGSCLLRPFVPGVVAVEKRASGAKRVAVGGLWRERYWPRAENPPPEKRRGPFVMSFEPEAGEFVEDESALATVAAQQSGQGRPGEEPLPHQALARVLGAAERVRVYAFSPWGVSVAAGFEVIRAYGLRARIEEGGEKLAKLYTTPRVVVDYTSAGYLEEERRRREDLKQQQHP